MEPIVFYVTVADMNLIDCARLKAFDTYEEAFKFARKLYDLGFRIKIEVMLSQKDYFTNMEGDF